MHPSSKILRNSTSLQCRSHLNDVHRLVSSPRDGTTSGGTLPGGPKGGVVNEEFNRLRVLWPDHLGLARGKYVPAALAERGVRHCTGTVGSGLRPGHDAQDPRVELERGSARPRRDLRDGRTAPGLGTRTPRSSSPTSSTVGPVLGLAARGAANGRSLTGGNWGIRPYVGMEFEAYLFESDGGGGWQPLDTPGAFVYGTGPSVDPRGIIDAIWEACEQAQIPLESVNSEYDTPQFEFTLRYTRRAARGRRRLPLQGPRARGRSPARSVADVHGQAPVATAVARDCTSTSRSATRRGRTRSTTPPTPTACRTLRSTPSRACWRTIKRLAGLCAPTVNAYKRLRPASLSGYWANWGYDHRGATVRVPPERGEGARLEHRLSDGGGRRAHVARRGPAGGATWLVNGLTLGPAESGQRTGHDRRDGRRARVAR